MIYSVEKIGHEEPCKYKVRYNYGAYKREFIGYDNLPKTVKNFLKKSSYAIAYIGTGTFYYYK